MEINQALKILREIASKWFDRDYPLFSYMYDDHKTVEEVYFECISTIENKLILFK